MVYIPFLFLSYFDPNTWSANSSASSFVKLVVRSPHLAASISRAIGSRHISLFGTALYGSSYTFRLVKSKFAVFSLMHRRFFPVTDRTSFSMTRSIPLNTVFFPSAMLVTNLTNLFHRHFVMCGVSARGSKKYLCALRGRDSIFRTDIFQVFSNLSKFFENMSHSGAP